MRRTRVIPVLLLNKRGFYKTQKFSDPKYLGDPINILKIFNDKEVDELFLLDIAAQKEDRTIDIDFVKIVADECYMPFGVGGGIKNIKQICQNSDSIMIDRGDLSAEIGDEKLFDSILEISDECKNQKKPLIMIK